MGKESSVESPAWLSIREAAAYLQVGEPTIYRWMRDNRITYRKVGDSTRFLREDLDAVIEVFPSARESDHNRGFCPSCHHDHLIEGTVRSTGLLYFQPARTRFWTLKDSNLKVRALMCSRCGVIVLRGDIEKLSALQASAAEPAAAAPGEEDSKGG